MGERGWGDGAATVSCCQSTSLFTVFTSCAVAASSPLVWRIGSPSPNCCALSGPGAGEPTSGCERSSAGGPGGSRLPLLRDEEPERSREELGEPRELGLGGILAPPRD